MFQRISFGLKTKININYFNFRLSIQINHANKERTEVPWPPASRKRRLANSTNETTDTQTVTALKPQPLAIDFDKLAMAYYQTLHPSE